jgi:hypothetical protein
MTRLITAAGKAFALITPDERVQARHRNAHVVRRELVLRGGLHRDAHGRHDDRELRLAEHPPQHYAVQRRAEERHRGERRDCAEPERQPKPSRSPCRSA